MRLDQLLVAIDTIKLWAESCFLAADNEDDLWYVKRCLADVAEAEAIVQAYQEAKSSTVWSVE